MEVQDDDVIYATHSRTGMTSETFRAVDLLNRVMDSVRSSQRVLVEGIRCKYLSVEGGGWKWGKLKLHVKVRLEFTPDVDPPPEG